MMGELWNMKKMLVVLVISFLLFCILGVIGSQGLYCKGIEHYYAITKSGVEISSESKLSFVPMDYNGKSYNLLAYNNSNLEVNNEGSMTSVNVGKNCISITSTILEVNNNVNKSIMIDLVEKLNTTLNSTNGSEIIVFNKEVDTPYIISKTDTYTFIDLVSVTKGSRDCVAYYRVILQDVRKLNVEITEEEYNSLPDYLPELLEVLRILEEDKQVIK